MNFADQDSIRLDSAQVVFLRTQGAPDVLPDCRARGDDGGRGDLAGIGSSVAAANAAAAGPTTAMLTAAADEVSTAIAAFFSAHAADYQRLAGQAAALHTQLERVLSAGAVAYAAAETTGTSPLQLAINAVSAPAQSLLARPIIGNGANATTLGGNGGDGGWLFGSGGNGAAGAAGQAGGSGGSAG
ncbi:PE family protein, partial [Mycobacterium ulcerans]